jgi:hypothetical protein
MPLLTYLFDHSSVCAPSNAILCDFDNGCTYTLRQLSDCSQSQTNGYITPEAEEGEKDDEVKRAAAELKNRTVSCIFNSP